MVDDPVEGDLGALQAVDELTAVELACVHEIEGDIDVAHVRGIVCRIGCGDDRQGVCVHETNRYLGLDRLRRHGYRDANQ